MDNQLVVQQESSALMALISKAATDPAMDVAKLKELLEVKERWEAGEARKAFVRALAEFKQDPPTITKNKHVGFTSRDGSAGADYWHATLDHVCDQIGERLSRKGLSFRWETKQDDKGMISVTCVLQHVLGHSERVTLQGMPDASGKKNSIQQVGSTVTYLQRYTLLLATGLATGLQDTDGVPPDDGEPKPDPWTDDLKKSAKEAAEKGKDAYAAWWKAQSRTFREAAVDTQQHADFKAVE